MKILLTGATGFVGNHMLHSLLRENHHVDVLKRASSVVSKVAATKASFVRYIDLAAHLESFKLEDQYDAVIHLATDYGSENEDIARTVRTNVLLPIAILQETYRLGCRLFVSTDSFFSAPKFGYSHMAEYILTKQQFLQWGKLYSATHQDLAFVNMRLEHVYGPGDGAKKFVPFVINAITQHRDELPLTHGDQCRDFIFVRDVIDAYLAVLNNRAAMHGATEFEVGTGKSIPVRSFVETVATLTNSPTRLLFGSVPTRAGEIMDSKADKTKLTNLGWSPKVSLIDGLREILS